jgi:hypothetical protein
MQGEPLTLTAIEAFPVMVISPHRQFVAPITSVKFMDEGGTQIGELHWEFGKLVFDGDVKGSARKFFDSLCGLWNNA